MDIGPPLQIACAFAWNEIIFIRSFNLFLETSRDSQYSNIYQCKMETKDHKNEKLYEKIKNICKTNQIYFKFKVRYIPSDRDEKNDDLSTWIENQRYFLEQEEK